MGFGDGDDGCDGETMVTNNKPLAWRGVVNYVKKDTNCKEIKYFQLNVIASNRISMVSWL